MATTTSPSTPRSSGKARRCGKCGGTDHIASNRKCPEYAGPAPTPSLKGRSSAPGASRSLEPLKEDTTSELKTVAVQAAAVPSELHCVRCHMWYRSTDARKAKACVVPHVFNHDSSDIFWSKPGYSKLYGYDSICCGPGKQFIEEGCGNDDYNMKKAGKCFRGSHTTRAADVLYNRLNVPRCVLGEDGKCKQTCLEDDHGDHQPVSGWELPRVADEE